MPIRKWIKPYERRTDATREVRSRIAIVEEVAMLTAPTWDAKKKKFVKKMTIAEACKEVGISDMTFRTWRQEDDKIRKYYEDVLASRKEMLHAMMEDAALTNVMGVLSGETKVRPMDKANLSMQYLKNTSPEFNPAIKLDVETRVNPALTMSRAEMEERIMELANSIQLTKETNEQGSNTYAIPATIIESPDGNTEATENGGGDSTWQDSSSISTEVS